MCLLLNCSTFEKDVQARKLLSKIEGNIGIDDKDLRDKLLTFIGYFANWDNSLHPTYLEVGRGLVKAAHLEETPLVVDPFSGGGSIPLEALRLGCDAFASDLNPVACLINQVVLSDLPRHASAILEELPLIADHVRTWIVERLREYYPPDSDGAIPVAYLWSRTVRCEQPHCGCEIPLRPSFWLSQRSSRPRVIRYKVVRDEGQTPSLLFEVFAPQSSTEVPQPTISRAKAICPACKKPMLADRVRVQLRNQHGGTEAVFSEERLGCATSA
jgi:putative DNA methylase